MHEVAFRCAEQAVTRGDERVATGPHRDRREAEGDRQRQPGTDEPAADAEEGAAGDGHVGAGARSDDRGGQHGQGADGDTDGHRGERLPRAQSEQDREGAEDDVRPGQVRAEEHRSQIARAGVTGGLRQVFDAGCFDRADAVFGELGGGRGELRSSSRERSSVEVRDAKRKLPAERHGELLARAVEISAAEGLSAVTLRRVATDLGVTPGLVSYYFSSAEQLITAAFRTAAAADLAEARLRVGAAETPTAKMDALMDYVLDESSEDASALWLDAWSLGRRSVALAAEANALTDEWLEGLPTSFAPAPGPVNSTWQTTMSRHDDC